VTVWHQFLHSCRLQAALLASVVAMETAAHRRDAYELWQELAPGWERGRRLLWESTRDVGEWLVERLDPTPGQTILEVAAGTGETGFLAAARIGPSGRLISSDLSPKMVEAAARAARADGVANVDCRVLDVERLELPAASVDGVLSRWGYVLKGDPPRALREIRRVLPAGGRFAFAVWGDRAHNPWMTVPTSVMVERGHLRPQTSDEIAASARRNPETIARLLEEAGLAAAEIELVPVGYRFADADELWFFVSELRGPVALALAGLDECERHAIRLEIERRAASCGAGGFELGGVSINVLAG
jgi:ubiquinone/menaquinone biosynthesis C-methylase UbiE